MEDMKNPYAREILQQKISSYKEHLAHQVAGFEANTVLGKRQNMAIENIEKLAKATYSDPHLYLEHKEDALIAIHNLDIDPIHKAKLANKAIAEIASSAGSAVLKNTPASILDPKINYDWKNDLDARSLIKFEQHATNAVNHENNKRLTEFNKLSKIHFKNILANGKGIDGIELKLSSLPEEVAAGFYDQEQLHINAHDVLEQVKDAPIQVASKLLSGFMTIKPEEERYIEQAGIYTILAKEVQKQENLAKKDPALFVEKLFTSVEDDRGLGEKIIDRIARQNQKGIASYNQKLLTNDEREEFRAALDSRDARVIQGELNNILKIEHDHESLGHKIVEEILADNKLSALNHFYIDANLHSRGNLKNDLARAMASGQALGEMSNNDKKEINDKIEKETKDWQDSILAGNTDNAPEVNLMRTGLLELARFYQFEKHLSVAESTNMAIRNMFKASYIAPYRDWTHGKFYVPKTVLDDGEPIELDEKNVNYGLQKHRASIINHQVQYDQISSFGQEYYKGELLDSVAVDSALRNGAFRLTKDRKSVYYIYFDDKGEHPLLKSNKEKFTIDLLELNKSIARNALPSIHPYGAI